MIYWNLVSTPSLLIRAYSYFARRASNVCRLVSLACSFFCSSYFSFLVVFPSNLKAFASSLFPGDLLSRSVASTSNMVVYKGEFIITSVSSGLSGALTCFVVGRSCAWLCPTAPEYLVANWAIRLFRKPPYVLYLRCAVSLDLNGLFT